MNKITSICLISVSLFIFSFQNKLKDEKETSTNTLTAMDSLANARLGIYEKVELTADLSQLKPYERKMLPLMIEAAAIMDGLFWKQAFCDKHAFLGGIANEKTWKFNPFRKFIRWAY